MTKAKKKAKKKTKEKKGLSVIVTIRGDEPLATQTVINARDRAGCPVEIVAVYDGTKHDPEIPTDQILEHREARGIGPSRHRGIKAAKFDVVLLVDAHMNFEKDYGKKILHHYRLKKNAKDVTCGRCIPSMSDLSPVNLDEGYTGARFSLKSEETGGEKWCLSGKWADQPVDSEIGCVFGACYAFKKDWYFEIGSPLELLRGWFGDEEYLSISSWLAGGRCFLIDYWVSHLFRDRPSFQWSRSDWMLPTVNRSRLLDLFPASRELKTDLKAWNALSIRSADADYLKFYEKDKRRPEVKAAKKLWGTWSDRVQPFLDRWVDEGAAPLQVRQDMRDKARPWKGEKAPGPVVDVPRVQQRVYILCANCGRKNTFRVDRTTRRQGLLHRYGKCREIGCQTRGVLIDRPDGQVIYWGKDAENL